MQIIVLIMLLLPWQNTHSRSMSSLQACQGGKSGSWRSRSGPRCSWQNLQEWTCQSTWHWRPLPDGERTEDATWWRPAGHQWGNGVVGSWRKKLEGFGWWDWLKRHEGEVGVQGPGHTPDAGRYEKLHLTRKREGRVPHKPHSLCRVVAGCRGAMSVVFLLVMVALSHWMPGVKKCWPYSTL